MTTIVAVDYDNGLALFHVNNKRVVVDINGLDVKGVYSANREFSTSTWMRVAPDMAYPSVWAELAEAAVTTLEIQQKRTEPAERKFRVPQAVKNEAQQSLDWVRGFDRGSSIIGLKIARMLTTEHYLPLSKIARISAYFSRRASSITEAAGWSPGEQGYPTDDRIRYGLWGGEAARTWTSKISEKHSLASTPPETNDGSQPHAYQDDPESPGECLVCGRREEAEIHAMAASAFIYDEANDYFGRGINPDETLVDALYCMHPDETWYEREGGEWVDIEHPSDDTILIMLDPESAAKLASLVDQGDPQIFPFELQSLNPHEAALVMAAIPELDFELIDRVFDIYDSQERSVNAKKQQRGAGGRFGESGAGEDDGQGKVKARLPQPMPLVPDVNARIAQYLAEVATQRGEGPQTPVQQYNARIQTTSITTGKISSNSISAQKIATGTIKASQLAAELAQNPVTDVRPLYLAIVDAVDTEAVLDVISMVPPAAGQQGDVTVFKRDKGQWVPDPNLLAQLRSVAPPPVVELTDDAILQDVIQQVDAATSGEEPKPQQEQQPPAQPQSPPPAKPDANPDQHPIPQAASLMALPDGTFLIRNADELKTAVTDFAKCAKNKKMAKEHIVKRAKALGRTDLLPEEWRNESLQELFTLWGPYGEQISLAEGGLDRNRGGAEKLRRYWTKGEGAAKIMWNTPGDWTRCVTHLSKYLGPRAKGYCSLRHKEVTGKWPGDSDNTDDGIINESS